MALALTYPPWHQKTPPTLKVLMACTCNSYPRPSTQPMVLITRPEEAASGLDEARRSSTAASRSMRNCGVE